MFIINLFVTNAENGGLKIGIEQIYYDIGDSIKRMGLHLKKSTVQDLITNELGEENRAQIVEELKRAIGFEPLSVGMKDGTQSKSVGYQLTYYTIPTTPKFQAYLINGISEFIGTHLFDSVIVSDGMQYEQDSVDFIKLREKISCERSFSSDKLDYIECLGQKICDAARNTNLNVNYFQFAEQNRVPHKDCLLAKNRFLIDHWDSLPEAIKNKKLSTPVYYVLEHAIKILSADDYQSLLTDIAKDAKRALFLPCLGKVSTDDGWYRFTYTEYEFIKGLQFSLVDGQLVIDLENNPGYQEFYAPNKRNHSIFKAEMLALAKYNGWEFEDTDFHQRMAFTRAYTDKIIQSGICGAPPVPPPLSIFESLSTMFFSAATSIGLLTEEGTLGFYFE